MTNLNESLLNDIEQIDEMVFETEQNVVFEMAKHCSKMMTFMEYADKPASEYIQEGVFGDIGKGLKKIGKWIIETITGFFKIIGKIISGTINKIKHFFSKDKDKKPTKSIHEIAADLNFPQHERIAVTKRPAHLELDGSSELRSIDANVYVEPLIVQMREGESFELKFSKQMMNFVNNACKDKFGNLPAQFPSISFATPLSIMLFSNKHQVMDYLTNAIQILEAMFLKKVDLKENEAKFISQVNSIISVARKSTTLKDYGFNCTLGELTEFQKKINYLLSHLRSEAQLVQKAEDDPEFTFSPDAMKCVNFLFVLLTITQITINAVGISITNIYVIPEQYTSTINDFDKMGEFVNAMIENNVPSKYIMLNAWLAGTPEFTGNPGTYDAQKAATYKPAMGHGRGCFFPEALTDSVYKIALNKRGTYDIENEFYVTNYVKSTPVAAKFAVIKRTNRFNTICEMEKIKTLDTSDTFKYGAETDKIIAQVEKVLPFAVRDLHTLNFGIRINAVPGIPDSKPGELIISDYGALKFNDKLNKEG